MKRLTIFALFIFLAASTLTASAQKVLNKPIDEWSQADAMEILSDSPWAKTYQSVEGAAAAAAIAALRDQSDNSLTGSERGRSGRSGGPPPVVFRLHSGLPIRLALIRLNQIAAGYEKMDDAAKVKFNESARGLLDCQPCQSYYIVSITQLTERAGETAEEGIFQGMSLDQMKGNITLRNDKGGIRQLVHFIPPNKSGDSAVFFFARADENGEQLYSRGHNQVSVVFDGAFLNPSNRFAYMLPRKMDFRISRITVGENIVF